MTNDKIIRKIAVIFVADVVGFSKMMESNEDLTLHTLRSCRGILDELFEEHGGRIFNTAGDSILAEFQSAVSALICATEFQKLIRQRNAALDQLSQMTFRIGINMGDVIVEGTNLYGDGVNVAARLEAFCQPGGVSLSKSTHDFVSEKVDLVFSDQGNQKVKNTIVHAFDVALEGVEERGYTAHSEVTNEKFESKPPTIAVLPFKNMSNDEEQEYFADGVTEDIISNLSSWKSFPVISRNSSFSFKGQNLKLGEIARQLSADYIVEGSIRKGGNKVRISTSLIDGKDDQQIWSKRWDRLLNDIFEVQDEVSQEVAALITPALKNKEHERMKVRPKRSFSAWDSYLQALSIFNQFKTFGDPRNIQVIELCNEAISKDDELVDAYVLKCKCIFAIRLEHSFASKRQEMEATFHELSERAYQLDPKNPEAVANYSNSMNMKGDFEQRIKYAKEALDLNPSHPQSNYQYAMAICNEGRFAEAEGLFFKAMELDPVQKKSYEGFFPFLYMAMGQSEKAIKWCRILYDRSEHSRYDGFCAAISVHLNDLENAKSYLRRFKSARPEIITLHDYENVAPDFIKKYLMDGVTQIWEAI